jgi:hypothetical protein
MHISEEEKVAGMVDEEDGIDNSLCLEVSIDIDGAGISFFSFLEKLEVRIDSLDGGGL